MPPLDSVPTYRYFSIVLHGSLRCYRGRHDSFLHAPFFYFALSLSLFISLPFCFAVVVFFRVLLFAVRCFVVDFFWVVDDFTAWSTAAILCGVTLKLFFFGVLPSLIGVFFLWPSASVHLLFTVQSKDQKLTTKNGQSKYRETRYTFHAFGFFILCFVLETSAHFKFSFQTI